MNAGMDVFFLTMGAAMVLAMHAGFAFLEAGTVRRKNQVNAMVREGVTLMAQLVGTLTGVGIAVVSGFAVYGAIKVVTGLRLSEEDEYQGADLAVHQVTAYPEEDMA